MTLSLIIITACNTNTTTNEAVIEQEAIEEIVQEISVVINEPELLSSGRTREAYLEDLDYLYYILRYNFPFFGVIYRRAEVDLHQIFEDTRLQVETQDDILHFNSILRNNIFRPARGMGHLQLVDEDFARGLLAIYGSLTALGHSELAIYVEAFDNPASRLFYNLSDEDFNFDAVTEESFQSEHSGNIRTNIIEEGRIAYVNIRGMNSRTTTVDQSTLLDFFAQVTDYEHLIIDIRGNPGGSSGFFPLLVMAPIISQPLEYRHYFFSSAHQHNMHFLYPRDIDFRQIDEALIERLLYINHDDLSALDLYFPLSNTIYPSGEAVFGGKIWLLVNEQNFSASEYAAAIANQTGFATLVGQTTGGDGIGMDPSLITLPNTGIVIRYSTIYGTDNMGRNNQEFGTEPHIFNMEGMDALETVLMVIEAEW